MRGALSAALPFLCWSLFKILLGEEGHVPSVCKILVFFLKHFLKSKAHFFLQ